MHSTFAWSACTSFCVKGSKAPLTAKTREKRKHYARETVDGDSCVVPETFRGVPLQYSGTVYYLLCIYFLTQLSGHSLKKSIRLHFLGFFVPQSLIDKQWGLKEILTGQTIFPLPSMAFFVRGMAAFVSMLIHSMLFLPYIWFLFFGRV